ncbi:MAG: hypothetical protein ACR2PB_15580, partial [Desulfocapsaceae bacterium]
GDTHGLDDVFYGGAARERVMNYRVLPEFLLKQVPDVPMNDETQMIIFLGRHWRDSKKNDG